MNIQVQRASVNDLDEIIALLEQLWPGKVIQSERIRRQIGGSHQKTGALYFCACETEKPIGFMSLSFHPSLWQESPIAYIHELVVDSKHRSKGIGCLLIEHAAMVARENGCSRLELDSAHERLEAHRFYEKMKFTNRALLFSRFLD